MLILFTPHHILILIAHRQIINFIKNRIIIEDPFNLCQFLFPLIIIVQHI